MNFYSWNTNEETCMIYKGIVIFRPEYQFKSTGILAKFRSPVVSFCLFAGGNIKI